MKLQRVGRYPVGPSLKVLVVVLLMLVSQACTNSKTKEKSDDKGEEAPVEKAELKRDPRQIGPEKHADQIHIEKNLKLINTAENPLFGLWVGAFGKNKINIALSNIEGDSIYGHSVCAGNFRVIKGTFDQEGENRFNINMREPGDDQYDGEFTFSIDLSDEKLTGSWKPYQNTVGAKNYTLTKRGFAYDPNIGAYPQGSTKWLDVPDVENLLPEEIELIRNAIYARHGYSFTNREMRRIFDAKDWYIPMSVDIREELTEKEAYNIDLLYNYEDYYNEYYNDYGR